MEMEVAMRRPGEHVLKKHGLTFEARDMRDRDYQRDGWRMYGFAFEARDINP